MSNLLRAFVVTLQVFSLAAAVAAQGVARPPKDEEPLDAALRLARGLEDEYNKEATLANLVRTHEGAGRLEAAVRAASAMKDEWQKAQVLSGLANSFAEAGQLERAAELLTESLRVMRVDEDDWSVSNEVLQRIVNGEMPFKTDVIPMRSEKRKGALARLLEAGRTETAVEILRQIVEVAQLPDFGDLAAAHVLAGAARLYAKSDAKTTASVLSDALAAARRVEEEDRRLWGLCEVARAYAEVGEKQAAEALLDEAHQSAAALVDDQEYELRLVASAYAALGLRAKSLKVSQEAGIEEWESLGYLLEAAASERPEALKESLARSLARASSLEGEDTKSNAISNLARSYGARAPELLGDVLWAARSLEDDYYRAQALATVGDSYAETGRKEAALDAWSQAYDAARAVKLRKSDFDARSSVRGDRDKLRLLIALASRFVGAGEYGRAPEITRDMLAVETRALVLADGRRWTVAYADAYLTRLADELTRAGQKETALAVLAEVSDAHEKLWEGEEAHERAEVLAAVGAAYAKAGDKRHAALYLRRAVQVAEGIVDYGGLRLSTLVSVGTRYAEAGIEPDARARKSLRRLVRDIETDRD